MSTSADDTSWSEAEDSDESLLRAFVQRGERRGLGRLFRQHCDCAYRVALRICGNSSDAEDVVQIAFLQVIQNAGQFRHQSSVRGWIMSIVINCAKTKLREDSRRRAHEAQTSQAPEKKLAVEHDELHAEVQAMLGKLPEHYRLALALHLQEGLSSSEVASALELSENTVRSQIARGLEKLREGLGSRGYAPALPVVCEALASAPKTCAPAQLALAVQQLSATATPVAAGGVTLTKLASAKAVALCVVLLGCLSVYPLMTWPQRAPDTQRPADTSGETSEGQPQPEAQLDEKLARILATKFDAAYRREYFSEVLTDLNTRHKLWSAYPPALRFAFDFTLEQTSVTVKDVLEKLAAAGSLQLEYRGDTVVFWKRVDNALLKPLVQRLKEGDVQARCEAAYDLAQLSDPRIYPPLFEALADPEVAVARWVLGIDHSRTEGLANHFSCLGFAENTALAVRNIVALCKKDVVPSSRQLCILVLGATRNEAALDPILALCEQLGPQRDTPQIRQIALQYFKNARVTELFIMDLKSLDAQVSYRASRLAERSRCGDEPRLAAALAELKKNGQFPKLPPESGEPVPNKGIERCLAILRGNDHMQIFSAIHELAHSKDQRAFAALVACAGERSMGVCNALAYSRYPDAIAALITLAQAGKSDEVRNAALASLGESQAPAAIEYLLTCVRDPDEKVRTSAVATLAESADPHAADVLLEALKNAEGARKHQWLGLIARTCNPRVVPTLLEVLNKGTEAQQLTVAAATPYIGDPRLAAPIKKLAANPDERYREIVAKVLPHFYGEEVVALFARLLEDPTPAVREAAASWVDVWHCNGFDKRILAACVRLLKDSNARVRCAVTRIFERVPVPEAFETLLAIAAGPDEGEALMVRRALDRYGLQRPEYREKVAAAYAEHEKKQRARGGRILPPKNATKPVGADDF